MKPLKILIFLVLSSPLLADEEKLVNLYTWAEYVPMQIIRDFEAEFGIKVNYDTYENDIMLNTKLLAGGTGYDIVGLADPALQRFLPLGFLRPLNKAKLPNLVNMDPEILKLAAFSDPGNNHAVIFTLGSTGIAHNLDLVLERMPDAPLDSSAMIFDRNIISHFANCGVSFLDDAGTVIRLTLIYLGYDINEHGDEALAEVESLLKSVRPYVQYFSSNLPQVALASSDVCVAITWSGDYEYARRDVAEAGIGTRLGYTVPIEGSNLFIDYFVMPVDLPHPENAHLFLNYLMRPEVAAQVTDFNRYETGNLASMQFIEPAVRSSPATFPPPEVRARMNVRVVYDLKTERKINRIWARVKAGMD